MNELVKLAKEHLGKSARPSWLTAWRELAEITSGLTAEDARLQPVLAALDVCDTAFELDDWAAFQEARRGVMREMQWASTRERGKA
jgi:hypothetical protein